MTVYRTYLRIDSLINLLMILLLVECPGPACNPEGLLTFARPVAESML